MIDYSGVVYLTNVGISQASGVLLWTGRHILTVAHFADDIKDLSRLEIGFNSDLTPAIGASQISIHPGWDNDPLGYNFDLAIIELESEVDSAIERYPIYRDFDEIGQVFTRVGYSQGIDPNTGVVTDTQKSFYSGTNRYDTTTDAINDLLNTSIIPAYQLSYDFDNGLPEQDAYGQILGLQDTGTGTTEIFANPGSSGGPAFIDGQVAGIGGFIFRYQQGEIQPDITDKVDSSYGELASDIRVAKYSQWIDAIVNPQRSSSTVPTEADAVDRYPVEGDDANTINYFLLQLAAPMSVDSGVSFETFDVTATAGEDYVYSSGQAIIPAGETSVAIGVEIIADSITEADEIFGIRVFEPFGGIFPVGVSELRAEHTIIDND